VFTKKRSKNNKSHCKTNVKQCSFLKLCFVLSKLNEIQSSDVFIFISENFLLSLINDQYSSEDEIFLNDNKNGFTKSIKKMCTRPDVNE